MKEIIIIFLLLTITLTVGCVETEIKLEESEIYPTFDIDASVVTNSSYNAGASFNEDDNSFSVVATSWTLSHIIRDVDNNPWNDPRLEFKLSLIPTPLATTDDQGTVYFSVDNLEKRIDTEGRNYRLITKSGGWYNAVWCCGDQVWYEEGSLTIDILNEQTLTLDLDVNQVGVSYMGFTNRMVLPIVFSNVHNTWSETYNVTFRVIRELSM